MQLSVPKPDVAAADIIEKWLCKQAVITSASAETIGPTYVFGSEHDERTGQRLQAFRFHARVLPVPGGQYRVQIGYSSTCAFNSSWFLLSQANSR